MNMGKRAGGAVDSGGGEKKCKKDSWKVGRMRIKKKERKEWKELRERDEEKE